MFPRVDCIVKSEKITWIIIVALSVAIASFTMYFYLGRKAAGLGYPSSLPGGYVPVKAVSGKKAVREILAIHGNPSVIPVKDAVIVDYSDGTELIASRVSGNPCTVLDELIGVLQAYGPSLGYSAPTRHQLWGKNIYLFMGAKLNALWCGDKDLIIWVKLGRSGIKGLRALIEYYG